MDEININTENLFKTIQEDIAAIEDKNEILNVCLDKIVESLSAERGFLVLYDKETNSLKPHAVYNLDSEILLAGEAISRTVLNEAIKIEKPLVLSDALTDPKFSDTTSVVLSGLRSVLCAPILSDRGVLGVIYIDNRLQIGAFKREHLQFLNECSKKISQIIAQYLPEIHPLPREN